MNGKTKLSGVTKAARAAGVQRLHIYLCCHGRRKPSKKVADAIRRYVTTYVPIKLEDHLCATIDTEQNH